MSRNWPNSPMRVEEKIFWKHFCFTDMESNCCNLLFVIHIYFGIQSTCFEWINYLPFSNVPWDFCYLPCVLKLNFNSKKLIFITKINLLFFFANTDLIFSTLFSWNFTGHCFSYLDNLLDNLYTTLYYIVSHCSRKHWSLH